MQNIVIDVLDGMGWEASWNARIDGVISEIRKIIENNGLAGNNPRLQ